MKGRNMAFTRQFLLDNGVPEDKVDAIMRERNLGLENYVRKTDADAAQDAAVKAAKEEAVKGVDVTKSEAYTKLQGEFDSHKKRTEARGSEAFKGVKGKFFDAVYDKLDHSKDYKEQLETLKKDYAEYFDADGAPPAAPKEPKAPPPVFSAGGGKSDAELTDAEKVSADFMKGFGGLPTTSAEANTTKK